MIMIEIGAKNKILRKTAETALDLKDRELKSLIKKMRQIMQDSNGIGLAANQIGISKRIFVAAIESRFYAFINPKITQVSKEKESMVEGCLSLPGVTGVVERPRKITIEGFNSSGKKIKMKAWGLLARIFQHEVDHLEGKLFIDKAKDIRTYEKIRKYEKD